MTEDKFRHQDNRASQLTYGQRAVGLTFNPGNSDEVAQCKQGFADEIDRMHALREKALAEKGQCEQARLASIAITELQAAQMWAVKAITWRD